MKKSLLTLLTLSLTACLPGGASQEEKDNLAVEQQQSQYAKAQPVPHFDFSLERDLLIKLYDLRNKTVSTFTVWRSDTGLIEGYCPSMRFSLPWDTSLTNPLQATGSELNGALTSIGQAEPNGVFASQNTSATWAFCINSDGSLAPHYIESKVTVYPCSLVDLPEDNQGPVLCSENAEFVKIEK